MLKKFFHKYRLYVAGLILFVSTIIYYILWYQNFSLKDELSIFSLGNQMSVMLQTKEGSRYIIDGGKNSEIIRKITKKIPFYSRTIDGLFLTSIDTNKIIGLIDIVSRYDVKNLYIPAESIYTAGLSTSTNETYEILLSEIKSKNIPVGTIKRGDSLKVGDFYVNILFPVVNIESKDSDIFEYSLSSPPSMVISVSLKGKNILIMGNVTKKIQNYIVDRYLGDKVDVLILDFSPTDANVSKGLINKMRPEQVVYNALVTKRGINSENRKSIATIMPNKLFNIRNGDLDISFGTEYLNMVTMVTNRE